MRFASTDPGRPAWNKFHELRREARRTAMRTDEYSKKEQVEGDLNETSGTYPLGGLPDETRDENWIAPDDYSGEVNDVRKYDPTI